MKILLQRISACFVAFALSANDACPKLPVVVENQEGEGLFSMVVEILGNLAIYDECQCFTLEVNFGNKGFYFDSKVGLNWWNYYFQPIKLGRDDLFSSDTVIQESLNRHRMLLPRRQAHDLIHKYIHVLPAIEKKVEDFFLENLKDYYIIGVHYRGTDSCGRCSYQLYLDKINFVINSLDKTTEYRIFVATDEQFFLDLVKINFPNLIYCQQEAIRSVEYYNGKVPYPVHKDSSIDRHRQGEEALIDCLLLSRCNIMLTSFSYLSICALAFNPDIPAIDVSSRTPEFVLK